MSELCANNNLYRQRFPWLTKEFLQEIIQRNQVEQLISVDKISIKPALKDGENYSSLLIRILCNYFHDGLPDIMGFILKIDVYDFNEISQEINMFGKETYTFRCILPKIENLLNQIGDSTEISAKLFDSGTRPTYLLFDDLSIKGYANINRSYGLHWHHLECALKKIAKFHAVTAAIHEQEPSVMKIYNTPIISETSKSFSTLLINFITACSAVIKSWPNFHHIYEKLIKFKETAIENCYNVFERNDNSFNCLCHGDLWVNNIMFKNDEQGYPIDCLLVDFQMCFWGSPGIDIGYLLYTSSNVNVQETEWENLIKIYYQELIENLKKINYTKKIPTLTDIYSEISERHQYALLMSLVIIAVRHCESGETVGIQVLTGTSNEEHNSRVKILSNSKACEALKFLLVYYDRKGYFN